MRLTSHFHRAPLALAAILLSAAATLGGAGAAWAQTSAADRALLDMRQAAQRGDAQRLASLLPQVQGHVLEPMAAYWALGARLDVASEAEILAFLTRWRGTYWEDRLRNEWLLQLGQRRQWDTLLREGAAFRMTHDVEVRCYTALARVHTRLATPSEVAPAVQQGWLGQRNAAPGCATAAGHLIGLGALPPELAWQRARAGMEAGRLAVAAQAVALLDGNWVDWVERAHAAPERLLSDPALDANAPHLREIATLALIRMARDNPSAAAALANSPRWQTRLNAEQRTWVWGAIGKRAALRLSDEAPGHFARASDALLPDDFRIWKARAALRAGLWPEVRHTIEHMSEALQRDPTWTYWLARALQASGRPEDAAHARQLYERIAGQDGFYEKLAAEALGRSVVLPPVPAASTAAERAAVRANAGLQRALAAIELGLRSDGVREWHYEVALHTPGGMADRELLAAAEWACERAVWDRCINTSSRTREVVHMAQRFPMPLRELVVPQSREFGLDPAYVYGLIRQESRFVTDARSHVGAGGLMQLMPETARLTARRLGLQNFQLEQVNDPNINVLLGTAYLRRALDNFEGSGILAAAAYNAGAGRPRQWRQGPELEAAIWIENIPFDETRDYVKRVLSNATMYAALLTGQPQRMSSRMQTVGPAASTVATAQASQRPPTTP